MLFQRTNVEAWQPPKTIVVTIVRARPKAIVVTIVRASPKAISLGFSPMTGN